MTKNNQHPTRITTEYAKREVIEKKILSAIGGGDIVAILATEADLGLIILALKRAMAFLPPEAADLANSLTELKRAAFPK